MTCPTEVGYTDGGCGGRCQGKSMKGVDGLQTTAPRGTKDVLPEESSVWRHVEEEIRGICRRYAYGELRPPVFEHTELFQRGVGETTDIVEKEMYTFNDRGGRSITLRPEITAGLVRAFIEHKLYAGPQPVKLTCIGPGFRYERPQAGRFRQFTQWDVEVFGAQNPGIDAEVIQIGVELAGRLGLEGLVVHLNSIGCPRCRPIHREKLLEYYRPLLPVLCESCQSRFQRNPLRLLDCKEEACRPAAAAAPRVIESLCGECQDHFDGVQSYLRTLGVSFEVDPNIVRGLDYYTKTVFEVIYPPLGAQSTVWAGGRYDGLVETLGGPPTPGVGFAMGMERLILTLDKMGKTPEVSSGLDVFIAPLGSEALGPALEILNQLRAQGFSADTDFLGRSLKSQMKHADRVKARYVAILGSDEIAGRMVTLRRMDGGDQQQVLWSDLPRQLSAGALLA